MRKIRKIPIILISVLFMITISLVVAAQNISLPPPPPVPGLGAPAASTTTTTTDTDVPMPAVPGEPAAATALTSAERQQYETQVSRLEQEKINMQNTIEQLQQQKLQSDKAMKDLVARVQEAEKTKPNYAFYISLVVIILLLIFILLKFLGPKKTSQEMPKAKPFDPNMRKLLDFIKNAREQGYDYESVSRHLTECGWSQSQIDKAYTYLK